MVPSPLILSMSSSEQIFTDHCKTPLSKDVMAQAVEMVGRSMNAAHLGKRVSLAQRDELIALMLSFMKSFQFPTAKVSFFCLFLFCSVPGSSISLFLSLSLSLFLSLVRFSTGKIYRRNKNEALCLVNFKVELDGTTNIKETHTKRKWL